MNTTARPAAAPSHWRRYRLLYLVLAVCAAPVLASYIVYYFAPPAARTNYGELIQPQRPLPPLSLRALDGAPFDARTLRGRWVMVLADSGRCAEACEQALWKMRQVRMATGKERDRIERLFLITDDAPLTTMILREYEGTRFLRADRAELMRFLEPPPGGGSRLEDHIWLIDPLGNLMLRWPPAADPSRMKRDLERLLRASRIG